MASGCLEHYSQLRCLDPAASCPWGGPFVVTEAHCDSIKAPAVLWVAASRSLQAVVSSAFVLLIVSFAIASLSSVSLILTWCSGISGSQPEPMGGLCECVSAAARRYERGRDTFLSSARSARCYREG